MNIKPLHDKVLIKRVDEETKTAGGIIIPDTAKEKPSEGVVEAVGNGRLDAVSNALRSYTGADFNINAYTEHALEVGSASKAVSYVEIIAGNGESFWGTGIDNDIITSSVKALVSAVNNMLAKA